ncbi:DUF6249 domain-containing protein [Spongiimicrobium salis]|uniref:DUF6249 domain-containing protein n=1 Tax=Spongiimicrobium salis TaxID=1667022 RepID=UPI00374D3469
MVGAVFIILFIIIFGIFYLYFSTRNRERLALIEKGADANIFVKAKPERTAPIWKILILNTALLLMGIGAGVVIGGLFRNFNVEEEVAFPGSIFFMAGTALLIGFFITKNMDKED